MMLTPSSLIDTQTIVKHIAEIVQSLQNQGYTVYLIGNWDKESERLLINLLENHSLRNIKTFFSHSIKKVKPTNDYYQNLLSKFALEPESCLMIDVEHQHTHAARQAKINNIIVINNHNSADLKNQLATYSIWI